MSKFLFYTDAHFTGKVPARRSDDFPQTLLAKTAEVYDIAKNEHVDAVLFGGDMFNHHRVYAFEIIVDLLDSIIRCPVPTYFIIGQHDLIGYNRSSFEYSTLGFITRLSSGKLLLLNEPLELSDCIIHPCHVFDDFTESIKVIPPSDKCNIMLVHALLSQKTKMFDVVSTADVPKNNVDIVLSGDLHSGYPLHMVQGTKYYNPGAMARLSCTKDEVERQVKCAVITIDVKMPDLFAPSGKTVTLQEFPLLCAKPAIEVFNDDALIKADEAKTAAVQVDNFVNELGALEHEAEDIYDFLELAARKKCVADSLIKYILKFRKDEKVL